MTDTACPACGTAMHTEQLHDVTVDRCPACRMVWFDRTELAAVVAHEVPGASVGWGQREPAEGRGMLACPRDGTMTLAPYRLGPAHFHRCSSCRGIAIADGELALLLESVASADFGLGRVIAELFSK